MKDLNKILFSLKKMTKQCDVAQLDYDAAKKLMEQIIVLADENNLTELENIAVRILRKLRKKQQKSMITDFDKMRSILIKKKEKIDVMSYREIRARCGFFKAKNKETKKSKNLNLYDIVFVPTQGGMHYSVITKIHKNHIECYPITTANTNQLDMIGCCYYPLTIKTTDGQQLYLTSSKTSIPYNCASRSYIREFENHFEIDTAISSFAQKCIA